MYMVAMSINNTRPIIIVAFLLNAYFTALANAEELSFDYKFLSETDLAMSIGDSLFNAPSDGCWTCHGSNGTGISTPTDQSQIKSNIKLTDRTTWTSYKFEQNYRPKNSDDVGQRDISISVIRLGADDWNKKMAPFLHEKFDTDFISYDDRMVGIHSKFLNKNKKSTIRLLKRNKIAVQSNELLDIMATSVFIYLETKFAPAN
ncbi:MAG: hypothetical protein O3A90_05865 [Proteobacteria bacterium]|jgi:mono/diheme cytochrome c family protein|nr:hypothetical protein [Pseudomonadota bacterium]